MSERQNEKQLQKFENGTVKEFGPSDATLEAKALSRHFEEDWSGSEDTWRT